MTPSTLCCYADTSGSEANASKDVMVTAGVVATKRKIDRFDVAWLSTSSEAD